MNNSTRPYFRGSPRQQTTKLMPDEVTLYIYIVTLVVGTIGNSLVVFSLMSKRRRRRMTANDVFILNLAVSDLLLLLIFLPYALYIRFVPFRPTVFVCKFTAPIITIALGGMVYTLTAMAVQRCLVITRPFSAECSLKRAGLIVAVIWVASIGLAIPKSVVATTAITPSDNIICISKWTFSHNNRTLFKPYNKTYIVTLFFLRFAFPFVIIIISYAKMAAALLKTQAPRFAADSSGNIRDVTNRKENMEVVKTLFVISFLFFALMLPYRVTRLMTIFGRKDKILRHIYVLTATLTIAHSCINPIIYGTFMRNFSQDYKRFCIELFCCRFCKKQDGEEATTRDRLELDDAGFISDNKTASSNKTQEKTIYSVGARSKEDSCLLTS